MRPCHIGHGAYAGLAGTVGEGGAVRRLGRLPRREPDHRLVFVELPRLRVDLIDDPDRVLVRLMRARAKVDVHLVAFRALGTLDPPIFGRHHRRPRLAVWIDAVPGDSRRRLDRNVEPMQLDMALAVIARLGLAWGRVGGLAGRGCNVVRLDDVDR